MTKRYLGDGVYVEFDGYSFVLTTENGIDVTNTVVLEPAVYLALVDYVTHRDRAKVARLQREAIAKADA